MLLVSFFSSLVAGCEITPTGSTMSSSCSRPVDVVAYVLIAGPICSIYVNFLIQSGGSVAPEVFQGNDSRCPTRLCLRMEWLVEQNVSRKKRSRSSAEVATRQGIHVGRQRLPLQKAVALCADRSSADFRFPRTIFIQSMNTGSHALKNLAPGVRRTLPSGNEPSFLGRPAPLRRSPSWKLVPPCCSIASSSVRPR